MRATDLMTEGPTFATELTTVDEALDLLYEQDIRHLPVVRQGELVGIISDRDLRKFLESSPGEEPLPGAQEPRNPTISTLMSTSPVQIDAETEAKEIVDLMLLHQVGALPVVDRETNEVLGIVSYVDLLRLLRRMLDS